MVALPDVRSVGRRGRQLFRSAAFVLTRLAVLVTLLVGMYVVMTPASFMHNFFAAVVTGVSTYLAWHNCKVLLL